jgi:hypothetical protein
MPLVEAFIPGTDPTSGQDVVLSAHLQEEQHSANDDASGCASLLEIGRALAKLIADGTLPRPKRNIRFWWTTENDAERQYFAANPRVLDSIWVNVNQDMVGADQAIGVMRTQDVTRLPAARFHFMNDVMEAAVDYMVAAIARTSHSSGTVRSLPEAARRAQRESPSLQCAGGLVLRRLRPPVLPRRGRPRHHVHEQPRPVHSTRIWTTCSRSIAHSWAGTL